MFNEKLTGFSSEIHKNKEHTSEIIVALKELKDLYESLKHFPGKHNQDDHAWNAGVQISSKKKKPSSSRSGTSLLSKRRNSFNRRYTRKNESSGVSSPFEAISAASAQARMLGATNPIALMQAVTVSTNLLRSWSDKYKTAIAQSDTKVANKLAKEFEMLSKKIADLGKKLGDDSVAQNIYQSIIQSYQESIMKSIPETKDVFAKYSLYDKNTPDKKMAKKVEQTILESKKEAE